MRPLFNNALVQWTPQRKSPACDRESLLTFSPCLIVSSLPWFIWNILKQRIWAAAQKNRFTVRFIGQAFPALLWQTPGVRRSAGENTGLRSDYKKPKTKTYELLKKCSIHLLPRPEGRTCVCFPTVQCTKAKFPASWSRWCNVRKKKKEGKLWRERANRAEPRQPICLCHALNSLPFLPDSI